MRFPIHVLAAAMVFVAAEGATGCKKAGTESAEDKAAASKEPAPAIPALGALAFLGDFEGEIDALGKDDKPGSTPTPLSLLVKAGKMRVAVPAKMNEGAANNRFGATSYVILDSGARKLFAVSDAKQQVVVMDLDAHGMPGAFGGAHGPKEPRPGEPPKPAPVVTKTGKYDMVAGYKCEVWDVTHDDKKGSLCVAEQGVSWFQLPHAFMPDEHAWLGELFDGKHFPLRVVGYAKDGVTEEGRIEVTKIDKRSLPQSDFEPPPAYKVLDLAQMAAAFSGMQGGMFAGLDGGSPFPMRPHRRPGAPHP